MLSEATIRRELARITRLWKAGRDLCDENYDFLRGAEFALAWVLEGKAAGTQPSKIVELGPEMQSKLLAAMLLKEADQPDCRCGCDEEPHAPTCRVAAWLAKVR